MVGLLPWLHRLLSGRRGWVAIFLLSFVVSFLTLAAIGLAIFAYVVYLTLVGV